MQFVYPRSTKELQELVSRLLCVPGRIGTLEMLVFEEGGKPENPEKNPQSRDENQQQTQPTYDIKSRNLTWATLMGGECP